ncbi:MAG: hypothetical protein JSV90_09170 [Methanobacteriota archaeon]|nr:MAG: hypothetical protein JSV90_09170 [Euryarchaeota archaeon]
MRERFAIIRRGRRRYAPAAPAIRDADARPGPVGTEYDVRKHVNIPEVAEVSVKRPQSVSAKGFTPLPRCSRCGTAVAHSQVICHGCGNGLGRL